MEALGCARQLRLLLAAHRPGGLAVCAFFFTTSPTPAGVVQPAVMDLHPLPVSMADRCGYGSSEPWEVRSFQPLWFTGPWRLRIPSPCWCPCWPSILAHRRFQHAPRPAFSSSSLGLAGILVAPVLVSWDLRSLPDPGSSRSLAIITPPPPLITLSHPTLPSFGAHTSGGAQCLL